MFNKLTITLFLSTLFLSNVYAHNAYKCEWGRNSYTNRYVEVNLYSDETVTVEARDEKDNLIVSDSFKLSDLDGLAFTDELEREWDEDSYYGRVLDRSSSNKYKIYFASFGRSRQFTAWVSVMHDDFADSDGENYTHTTNCTMIK